jgi:hypothetical protein
MKCLDPDVIAESLEWAVMAVLESLAARTKQQRFYCLRDRDRWEFEKTVRPRRGRERTLDR